MSEKKYAPAKRKPPFAGYVYNPAKPLPPAGKPYSCEEVKPWIPGVSTPEGNIVSASLVENVTPAVHEFVQKASQVTASSAIAAVSVGIPLGSFWIGIS